MKLGVSVSTYNAAFGPIVFKGDCLAENLAVVKRLGYTGVDLFVDRRSAAEIDAIGRLLAAAGVEIANYVGIFMAEMGLDLSCTDPARRGEYLQLYRSQIDHACRLGSPHMPVGNIRGPVPPGDSPERYCERLADSLHALCGYAAARGVTLCLEPTNRYECNSLNSAAACVRFIEAYHLDRLGLLLDTFHMNIEDVSIPAAILQAGGRIRHFHCPDSGRAAAGSGHLDYAAILCALKTAGYQGYLMLEAFPWPDALTCARDNIEYLQRKLAETDAP
jgi:sugar phosphate isomerase/epimerase